MAQPSAFRLQAAANDALIFKHLLKPSLFSPPQGLMKNTLSAASYYNALLAAQLRES